MDIAVFLGIEPRPVLYHYTTPSGFLGITETGTIWATGIHYLNDSQKFHHALSLFASELRRRASESPDKNQFFEWLADSVNNIRELKIFVCSFSQDQDLLSQWRAYCPGGGGISLGFPSIQIAKAANSQGYIVAPCAYGQTNQRKIVAALIDDVLPKLFEMVEGAKEHEIRGHFYRHVVTVAPFLKHPAFEEEREWRCALLPSTEQLDEVQFRSTANRIIPYHAVDLGRVGGLEYEGIVVGPTETPRLQMNSAGDVLRKHGIKYGSLRASAAPYRAW